MLERASPNHNERPAGTPIDMLVFHYTGMRTAVAALDRLCDPEAKVSAHYLIDTDGAITRLVAEERRAWHAGVSFWRGETDINGRSIGIELVNPGHEFGYEPFGDSQIASLEILTHQILDRHPIPARNVVGHSDVAPMRKRDPGELFPWARLARSGIGPWPAGRLKVTGADREPAANQKLLRAIGYELPDHGHMDGPTRAVITAFQRRFRPQRPDGRLDAETAALIHAVADLVEEEGQ